MVPRLSGQPKERAVKKPEQKVVKITKRKQRAQVVRETVADVVGSALGLKKKDDAPGAPVQQYLPAKGMVDKLDPELDELAGKVTLAEEKAKSATSFVKERKDVLIQKMKAKGRTTYVNRGLGIEINLEAVDRVKVKQYDQSESSDYE